MTFAGRPYVSIYLYNYAHLYTCISVFVYISLKSVYLQNISTYLYVSLHTSIYLYIYLYVSICLYISLYTLYLGTFIYLYTCVYVYRSLFNYRICTCAYLQIYIHMYIPLSFCFLDAFIYIELSRIARALPRHLSNRRSHKVPGLQKPLSTLTNRLQNSTKTTNNGPCVT